MRPAFRALAVASALAGIALTARPAAAIPVFANGQGGVSCEMCHSSVPALNAYGRYILATNFARVLDAHAQMLQNKRLPVAVLASANRSSVPNPSFGTKIYAAVVDLLSAGYIGPKVTYYASVPIEEGGFPAPAVDQLWVAYDGLAGGNGSLQVGKFPTPFFAPWVSQTMTLSGYGLAALPVGLNSVGVGDNRWGISYTQIGGKGLIANVAYMTNTGPEEEAYDEDIDAGGEGTAWVGSVQYLWPASRWSGGVTILRGSYPLPSGASDQFTRNGALLSYGFPKGSLMVMGLQGYDSNPNDGATPPSTSHGLSFETMYGPVLWLNLDLRYDTTNDGLGTLSRNYVMDASFNVRPNIVFTVEDVASVGGTPVFNYQLLWSGPWWRQR